MNSPSSVAIILLNWNGYQDTFECLKSLECLTYPNFHVFVVDNASTDDSYSKFIKDQEGDTFKLPLTFIQSGSNLGCAGGNNVGIRTAYEQGFDYYWMLNNDTYVEPEALSKLVEVIDDDEQVGIVGSKIYNINNNLLWFAGGTINPYLGTSRPIGINEKDYGQYDKMKEVDFIVGCSMLFRKELIQKIGFLDEDYFIYYEDTDWNLKAKRAGMKIVYVPSSIIHHKESSSTKSADLSPYYAYYLMRNGYLMVCRNNAKYKWLAFMYIFIRIIKFHILYVLNCDNKLKRSSMIIKGAIHGIKNKKGQYIN
ncbi:glycosyltransferase family 2 protein [Bacillus sp. B15-48]|uniref:glycosyltransferase family 2 protein n=1 Tax=Bacillus sp. B15-48 TaxID=1548601 RepID=UPI00193FB341|nr:glycosyltransferase family 2 protein [Bacillus sp. B15-48]MBM4764473.1 glycosyltransferase [Bacillus sp. B15-48]